MCNVGGSYIENGFGRLDHPTDSLAIDCARDALALAGVCELGDRDGLILATTTGNAMEWEPGLIAFIEGNQKTFPQFPLLPLGTLLEQLANSLNFRGHRQLVTSACAAGIHAITIAAEWVRSGRVDRCLVGGTERLCQLVREGFDSLKLLTRDRCRPFDLRRSGINLAEGAAFLLLDSKPNSRTLGRIGGSGASLDSHHMTAPHPEGEGSLSAMKEALEKSGLSPSDVDWIHAHGTGSRQNDQSESIAIGRLFDGHPTPPVTSTKGAHGHFLAATGIVEVQLVLESIRRGRILGTTGFSDVDPELVLQVQRESKELSIRHVLKNILGFGGSNGALVVSAP